MVATYKDLGIDLLVAIGVTTADGADGTARPAASAAKNDLLKGSKSSISLEPPTRFWKRELKSGSKRSPCLPRPPLSMTKPIGYIETFWQGVASAPDLLKERAGSDAAEMYAHVLQSTNQGDPGLLPEEILAISEACPAELTEWQLNLLAQFLKTASSRSSTGPFLQKLREGTTFFGPQDDGRRERTAKFLSDAQLAVEAFDYLPLLEKAREKSDTQALVAHARYHEARSTSLGNTPEAQRQKRSAWELYCEIAMMDKAEFAARREAMGQAIELLPSIPPGPPTNGCKRSSPTNHWHRQGSKRLLSKPCASGTRRSAFRKKRLHIDDEGIGRRSIE